jgi:hypothetical protein
MWTVCWLVSLFKDVSDQWRLVWCFRNRSSRSYSNEYCPVSSNAVREIRWELNHWSKGKTTNWRSCCRAVVQYSLQYTCTSWYITSVVQILYCRKKGSGVLQVSSTLRSTESKATVSRLSFARPSLSRFLSSSYFPITNRVCTNMQSYEVCVLL